jgi:hypothetical protein
MPRSIPLWTVPLAIALAMLIAGHLAWWLSMQAGHIPACNPYWDGCTSISRAARHGLGNHLFRLLMLPCALLLAIHWWLSRQWLRDPAQARDAAGAWLLALGLVAAHALAVYVAFLGTEGKAYEFMRRYGITLYFGCGYLAQLLFLRLARRRGRLAPRMRGAMTALCVAMLALGVTKLAGDALIADPQRLDRLADALEWQLGGLLAGWYLLQAWHWRGERLALSFGAATGHP